MFVLHRFVDPVSCVRVSVWTKRKCSTQKSWTEDFSFSLLLPYLRQPPSVLSLTCLGCSLYTMTAPAPARNRHNMNRAFSLPFLTQMLVFLGCITGPQLLVNFLGVGAGLNRCLGSFRQFLKDCGCESIDSVDCSFPARS